MTASSSHHPRLHHHQLYAHSRVDFVDKDGNLLLYVLFSKQSVEEEAKRYAGGGYSLMDERGQHWFLVLPSAIYHISISDLFCIRPPCVRKDSIFGNLAANKVLGQAELAIVVVL